MTSSSIHQPVAAASNSVGRATAEHPGLVKAGRAGWFAKGVVYLLAGFLALSVAVKAAGWSDATSSTGKQEASPTGAIKTVAGSPGGTVLLWLLAIGLLLYAAWRDGDRVPARWHRRQSVAAPSRLPRERGHLLDLRLQRHRAGPPSRKAENGNQKVTDISASIMAHTAGRLVIGVVGAIIIAAGLYRVYKGVTMDVNDELDLSGMSPGPGCVDSSPRRRSARWGGGSGIGLVGFFMLRAAIIFDANEATGLDGALRRLATQTWGLVVVFVVGVGFAAYGIFCLATFTHRRLQAP